MKIILKKLMRIQPFLAHKHRNPYNNIIIIIVTTAVCRNNWRLIGSGYTQYV